MKSDLPSRRGLGERSLAELLTLHNCVRTVGFTKPKCNHVNAELKRKFPSKESLLLSSQSALHPSTLFHLRT